MKISQILCSEDAHTNRVRQPAEAQYTHQSPSPEHLPSSVLSVVSPARSQSKWSGEEDVKVIRLRNAGMKWEDVAKELPGRSDMACRLHFQNYLEKRSYWDDDLKNRLAYCYESNPRSKKEMWSKIAEELGIPWKNAEAMHWQIGYHELAVRAGVPPFQLSRESSVGSPPTHRYSSGGSVGYLTDSSVGSTSAYATYNHSSPSQFDSQNVQSTLQPAASTVYATTSNVRGHGGRYDNSASPAGKKDKQRRKRGTVA